MPRRKMGHSFFVDAVHPWQIANSQSPAESSKPLLPQTAPGNGASPFGAKAKRTEVRKNSYFPFKSASPGPDYFASGRSNESMRGNARFCTELQGFGGFGKTKPDLG